MEAIKLDILPGAMPPIVHVSQGDIGRQFKISIYDETGAAYSLTGKTLSIVGHKQDGNVFQYAIASSAISGNEVTITTEEQMTPVAGKTLCEITIEQGNTKLGTANFVMQVEQGPADMGLMSTSALYIIQALFNEATEDIETAQAAATTATQKAAEAAASVAQIGDSVQIATQAATNAAASASSAATSASQAAAAVEGVHDDAVAAQNAATAAATSASAASTSASAAATSATSASNYASAADTSADAASDYASAASQSATAAATSASNASSSASDASTAATNAANSATDAAGSANDASTYASNAAASATAAAGSASDASTYAGNAATSATNAANSATAAAGSASDAEDAKEAIEDMTVSSQTVPYTSPAEVTKTIVQGVVNLDFKIPRGEPMSGHEVIANPSGAATGGDLTKLGIDGTNYNVSGLPDYSQASNGDVLTKTASGPAWAPAQGGGGGAVIPITPSPMGVIWEIYDHAYHSNPTKLYDRSTDSYFDFVAGTTYYLRLGASGESKQPLSLAGGKSIFFDSAVGGWITSALIPGVSTLDFSDYAQELSALGTQDRVTLIPNKLQLFNDYFSSGDVTFTSASVIAARESGDQSGVLLNKCKYVIEAVVNCTTSFRWEPWSAYSVDIVFAAANGEAELVGSNYVTM